MSSKDPQRKKFAESLRRAREDAGYDSARKAAQGMKINPETYAHHENGTRAIRLNVAKMYATFFNIDIGKIFDMSGLLTPEHADFESPVVSEAKMGVWRSSALDVAEHKENTRKLSLPPPRGVDVRLAIEMADESANRSIPSGWFGIYTPLDRPVTDLHNKLVYVERELNGLTERTIRRAILMPDGSLMLQADTDDKRYKDDVVHFPAKGEETVSIIGRIVGKYVESDDL